MRFGEGNGPMVGHRAEKDRKTDGYEVALVRKFETQIRCAVHIRPILNKYMDKKGKKRWVINRLEKYS